MRDIYPDSRLSLEIEEIELRDEKTIVFVLL